MAFFAAGVIAIVDRRIWLIIAGVAIALGVQPLLSGAYSDSGHEVPATAGAIALYTFPALVGRAVAGLVRRSTSTMSD